jgi:hypothetical protein
MTSCYSTTGSFSCSAVNNDSGAWVVRAAASAACPLPRCLADQRLRWFDEAAQPPSARRARLRPAAATPHQTSPRCPTPAPAGAKTPLANLFCGCLVGFTLLVLCPVFEKIPMNVLGAVIIVGVAGGRRGAALVLAWLPGCLPAPLPAFVVRRLSCCGAAARCTSTAWLSLGVGHATPVQALSSSSLRCTCGACASGTSPSGSSASWRCASPC